MTRAYLNNLMKRGQTWFGSKSPRDQWIIAVVSVVALGWLMYVILVEPLVESYEQNKRQISQVENTISQHDREIRQLRGRLTDNPNQQLEREIEQLQRQISLIDSSLVGLAEFIEPRQLMDWVHEVLAGTGVREQTAVRLRSFSIQQPQPFMENQLDVPVYQHNLELVLEGRYFAVRDYLRRLQDAPYGFYWVEMNYEVQQYPTARVTLYLYTLTQEGG